MINKLFKRMTGDPTYANINYYDDFPILFVEVNCSNRVYRAFDTLHAALMYVKNNKGSFGNAGGLSINIKSGYYSCAEKKYGNGKNWIDLLEELMLEYAGKDNGVSSWCEFPSDEKSIRELLRRANCEADFRSSMCYGTNWKKGF